VSADKPEHYGAAAIGRAGQFEVEIDECLDGDDPLLMSIGTRGWQFRFALAERSAASRLFTFLREQTGRLQFSELLVGSFQGSRVLLIKDDEFPDRFFLRAIGDDVLADFTLLGDDVRDFAAAVSQAVDDLGQ